MQMIFEAEAQRTFNALSEHIKKLTEEATAAYGEEKWQLCFDFDGYKLNAQSIRIDGTLIIFSGKMETVEYERAVHYAHLSYIAFVIPTPNERSKAPVIELGKYRDRKA